MAVGFGLREECGESSGCTYFSVYHYILGKPCQEAGRRMASREVRTFFSLGM